MINVNAFFDELENIMMEKGAGVAGEVLGRAKYIFGKGKATPGMRASGGGVFGKSVSDTITEGAGRANYTLGKGKSTKGMRANRVGPLSHKGLQGQ